MLKKAGRFLVFVIVTLAVGLFIFYLLRDLLKSIIIGVLVSLFVKILLDRQSKVRELLADVVNYLRCERGQVSSNTLYQEYQRAQKELIIQVKTWPVFGEREMRSLRDTGARRIFILGPVDEPYTWPGVLWRFSILHGKIQRGEALLLHIKDIPLPIKFIVVDRDIYTAPAPNRRTPCYDVVRERDPRETQALKSIIYEEIYARGDDALLRLYLEIHQNFNRRDISTLADLREAIIGRFRHSVNEQESILGREHKRLARDRNRLQNILGENVLRMFIDFVNQRYGLDYITVDGAGNILFRRSSQVQANIFRNTFESTINFLEANKRPPIGEFPKIRIVLTETCALHCIYCPPGNESYPHNAAHSMAPNTFHQALEHAYDLGFRKMAITGGEPLPLLIQSNYYINVLSAFMQQHKDTQIYINTTTITNCSQGQTSGVSQASRHFDSLLNELNSIEKHQERIIFKISLDGILPDILEGDNAFQEFLKRRQSEISSPSPSSSLSQHYPKIACSQEIIENIKKALKNGYKVGVNFVLTKDTRPYLVSFLLYLWYLAQSYPNRLYAKILDLNWYRSIGQRHGGVSQGEAFWLDKYLSPLKVYYEENLHSLFGQPSKLVNLNTGIPMVEARRDGFTIRIKDSAMGTHYIKPHCFECPYFLTNRCQEGVYEPWVTPEGNLKLCYNNPNIVDQVIGETNFQNINLHQIRQLLTLEFKKYY